MYVSSEHSLNFQSHGKENLVARESGRNGTVGQVVKGKLSLVLLRLLYIAWDNQKTLVAYSKV